MDWTAHRDRRGQQGQKALCTIFTRGAHLGPPGHGSPPTRSPRRGGVAGRARSGVLLYMLADPPRLTSSPGTAPQLVPTAVWHLGRPDDFESFVVGDGKGAPAGCGSARGAVSAWNKPLWIMDITWHDIFPRAKAVSWSLGVKGAFGFPVSAPGRGRRGAGVLHQLSRRNRTRCCCGPCRKSASNSARSSIRSGAEQALRESEQQFHTLADLDPPAGVDGRRGRLHLLVLSRQVRSSHTMLPWRRASRGA